MPPFLNIPSSPSASCVSLSVTFLNKASAVWRRVFTAFSLGLGLGGGSLFSFPFAFPWLARELLAPEMLRICDLKS